MTPEPAVIARTELPRDVADLLIDLSVALHKYGMYPDGHPQLRAAVSAMARRLEVVLMERRSLTIAVARDRMVIDGVETDASSPVTRDLARRLYRREVGAFRLTAGLGEDELTGALRVVARESGPIAPRGSDGEGTHWRHIELLPLSYDRLRLQDDDEEGGGGERDGWASDLWQRLARSVLAGPRMLPDELLDLVAPIESIADGNGTGIGGSGGVATDILGALGQYASELASRGRVAARAAGRTFSDLVRRLSPAALERLLRLGGDQRRRHQLLRDATGTLEADAVLDLARAVARASGHSMSEALLLLLSKLAKHAQHGDAARRAKADEALRQNIRQLIDDWDGAADLPEDAYWKTLEQLLDAPSPHGRGRPTPISAYEVPPEQIVMMSLEAETFGTAAKHAVADMVRQGKVAPLLALADATPASNAVLLTLRRHLDNTRTVRRLLQDDPVDFAVLQPLVRRVGFGAASALIDALEAEDDRGARWKLFELLGELGPKVGTIAAARLPRAPWYLQRNLLLLFARLDEWPPEFTPLPYAQHPDPRVRREAYALLLVNNPASRDRAMRDEAICAALEDEDERIVRAALNAALECGLPRDAVPRMIDRLANRARDGMLGVLAVRVLAPVRLPEVRDCFVALSIAPRRRWFRRVLAPKSPVVLAALTALANGWPGDPVAARVLALAERDRDPEVQTALRPGRRP